MIHYHGTPIGGPRVAAAQFLQGRHGLVSFAHQDDMGVVADVCKSFVLDNGAFTTWKKGTPLDVTGFIAWVRNWQRHPGFQWALIPDSVDGGVEENDALLMQWPTDLVYCGVPVYHLHEPIERLTTLAEFFPTVALGSSGEYKTPGTNSWWGRMHTVMAAICDADGRPRCRLHGLRMLDPRIFTRLPLASADSTNAGRNCNQTDRFGMYVPPTAAQRAAVIADRIESFNSAPRYEAPPKEEPLAA